MKMLLKKRMISLVLIASLLLTVFAVPASAMNIGNINASTYNIEVDGILFNVTVTPNIDGTKSITVVGNGEVVSWSSENFIEEVAGTLDTRMTGSYDSYRYIYSSSAASVWNLYRPLQDDGGAWAKGVPEDNAACRSFASEVESMKAAEERVNQYLADEDLANTFGVQLLLSGAGSAAGFLVAHTLIASTIAGMVAFIISSYAIPALWQSAIAALVEVEYYNIRNAMIDANYYFELA